MPIGEWRKIREAISDAKSKKWSEALEDFGVAIDTLVRRIEEVVDNKLDIFDGSPMNRCVYCDEPLPPQKGKGRPREYCPNPNGKASKCGRLRREEKCLAEHGETPNARFSRLYQEKHGVSYYKHQKERKKQ